MTRLRRRQGVFYYRARIPADLRALFKRPELSISLRTTDAERASEMALEVRAKQLRLCRTLRQARGAMAQDHIDALLSEFLDEIRANAEDDAINFTDFTSDEARERSRFWRERLRETQDDLAHNRLSATERQAGQLLTLAGTSLSDSDFRRVCSRLLRINVDEAKARVDSLPPEELPSPTLSTPQATPKQAGPRVSELVKDFMAQRDTAAKPMKPRTRLEFETSSATLVDLLGDPVFSEVRNRDAQDYSSKLAQLPNRWRQAHKGTQASEVLRLVQSQTYERAAPATIKKELNLVKAFWKWACTREELERNAMKAVAPIDVGNVKEKRKAFTDEDLEKLRPAVEKQREKRPERYWIAMLLAYSGARLEEIAQLRKQDVIQSSGIWCIDITPDAGSLKNAASEREIPIHSAVLAKGFLRYVESCTRERLFADKKEGRVRGLGQPISAWLNREIKLANLPDVNQKVLHSFRHTMTDRLRATHADPVTRREILGHAHEDVEDKVYGDPTSVKARSEALEKVVLPL